MILFYCTAMEELAKKIAKNERIVLGKINWDKFPDGFPNIFIENVESVRKADVAFLASFTPETIFEQLAVIYALPKYGAKSLKIILPYFPVGTMDRVVKMGEIVTAKTLARMLSAVEIRTELVVYDIHDAHEWHYFDKPIDPRLESAILDCKCEFDYLEECVVAFPDAGAWKRFGSILDDFPQIICHKERLGDKRKLKIIEGSPRYKNVVIVDDLIMTGNTILECAKLLEAKGAKSVSACAIHAVFPNKSWVNMRNFPFTNFWITDSCPETLLAFKRGPEWNQFKILSLAPSIAKILTS